MVVDRRGFFVVGRVNNECRTRDIEVGCSGGDILPDLPRVPNVGYHDVPGLSFTASRPPSHGSLPQTIVPTMPLFEIETDAHIIITWANDEDAAREVVDEAYPEDELLRLTKRPRDSWVISKGALGLTDRSLDPCMTARDCLSKSAGDKVNAIRLYRMETGCDLEQARRAIESNMVMGW